MTESQENQVQQSPQSDKELNFRALEAKFQRQIEQERASRAELERQLQEARNMQMRSHNTEEEESDEPYVDHKKLDKKLSSFEKKLEEKIEKKAEEKARALLEQNKRETWLRNNPDFYDVLQHADKFASADPELAETILEMPEGFERQKLVYKNIKALGLHKPQVKEPTIQDKIDANRRSPFYQPSGMANSPYTQYGDYSNDGQKKAYEKMQALKKQLRI